MASISLLVRYSKTDFVLALFLGSARVKWLGLVVVPGLSCGKGESAFSVRSFYSLQLYYYLSFSH